MLAGFLFGELSSSSKFSLYSTAPIFGEVLDSDSYAKFLT